MQSYDTAQSLCKHALGTDPYRKVLTHFAISTDDKATRLVATDTHRLATCKIANHFKMKEGVTQVLNGDAKATYPKWQRVVPTKHTKRATCEAASLLLALKCLLPTAKLSNNRCIFEFGADSLTITTRAEKLGEASFRLRCENDCEGFRIAFNGKYIEDAVKSIRLMIPKAVDSCEVAFGMTEASRPIALQHSELDDYLEVVMPMALA